MITLKIGRNSYDITGEDVFIDNGACVQLKAQRKEVLGQGDRPRHVLSKRAAKEIDKFERVIIEGASRYDFVTYFRLGGLK